MLRRLLVALTLFAATLSAHAQSAKKPDRPLIFIPGILGSQIWIGNEQVWVGAKSLLNLGRLRIPGGPKRIEPAATCASGSMPGNCGLIESIGILGPLKIDQYSGFIHHLEAIGYTREGPSRNLYIFSYDWRRSSFDTADELKAFIASTPGLAGKDVDIVAHSLGGLAALVYAHRYDAPTPAEDCATSGRCRIKTMITAGTPYYGSMNAVATPVEGWGWASRVLAGGSAAITGTVLSWPSFYELLPTYSDCCGMSGLDSMADHAVFARLPYVTGPSAPDPNDVKAALQRRRDLDALAKQGWPEHIAARSKQCDDDVDRDHLYMIAGDHNDTKRQLTIKNGDLAYDSRRGDGTVLLRSASLNSPSQAWLSFTSHRSILDDDNVRAKVENILLRCDFAFIDFKANEPSVNLQKGSGGTVDIPVESASANIIQGAPAQPLVFSVRASLSLSPPSDDVEAPSASVSAKIDGRKFLTTDLNLMDVSQEGTGRRYAFAVTGLELPHPGLVEIEVVFSGSVSVADQAMAF